MFSAFLIFCYYLHLEKGVVLHLYNSESLLPKDDLCNFGCNWPSGSGEELIDMQMSNRQTMDDQESSPGELNISTIQSRIPI
jgi:hypothetical protein